MTIARIGVVGAGTMGAGIAQIACLGGLETLLHDPVPDALGVGIARVEEGLAKGAARGRWSDADAEAAKGQLRASGSLQNLGPAELVIEAAPEELGLKRQLMSELAEICGPDAILATNTSSLPVTAIAAAVPRPERVCGMHFFNPPALMELVEIVAGDETSEPTLAAATEVARRMGRTPIRTADGPGFLANRLFRPFSLEALRMLGEGIASHEEIDRIYRLGGGFRMGPFELMDQIGLDVGFEVARSFWEQSFHEPRWQPHPIQARMVEAGRHGRKTGRGYYSYGDGPHRDADPELDVERPIADEDELARVAGERAPEVLSRVVVQIVNEAAFALEARVGSADDMDTAMRLGFNWPLGPIEWSERLDLESVLEQLDRLRELRGEVYRAAPVLRRAAAAGAGLRTVSGT